MERAIRMPHPRTMSICNKLLIISLLCPKHTLKHLNCRELMPGIRMEENFVATFWNVYGIFWGIDIAFDQPR
jgi:hypothetical protein